jgi:hypothetical protein
MAILAIPLKAVESALGARHFDHDSNASCHSLRRMTHVPGQKKNISLIDRNFNRRFARGLHQSKKDVSLQLVEEFLGRVVVIVAPLIGSAHYRDH